MHLIVNMASYIPNFFSFLLTNILLYLLLVIWIQIQFGDCPNLEAETIRNGPRRNEGDILLLAECHAREGVPHVLHSIGNPFTDVINVDCTYERINKCNENFLDD